MIYFISLLCGMANGLFAAAAGQIMVFYLVFILKKEAHEARGTSIFCLSLATIISLMGYIKLAKFKLYEILITIACSIVFGILGSKIMKKIKSNWLNLISGVLVFGLGVYKLIFK
jgi:uncharacterized membrane protein YfcA